MSRLVKQKWICYILVLIMAFTCTSVGVYAAGESGEDVQAGASDVVTGEPEGEELQESLGEGDVPASVGTIDVRVEIDEETGNAIVSWDAVEGADKYAVAAGDFSQELTETTVTIEGYAGAAISVKAYAGDVLLAEGLYTGETGQLEAGEFAAPVTKQRTMKVISDKDKSKLAGDKGTKSTGREYDVVVDRPIDVSWKAVDGAKYYDVYRMVSRATDEWGKNATDEKEVPYLGKWLLVEENVTGTTYHDQYRSEMHDYENKKKLYDAGVIATEPIKPKRDYILGGSYTYKIVAKTDKAGTVQKTSAVSKAAIVPDFLKDYKNLIWHVKPKATTKLYKSRTGSASRATITKSNYSKILIKTRKPYRSNVKVFLKNGKVYEGWMIRKKIGPALCKERYDWTYRSGTPNVRSGEITNRDYSIATKEKYANKFSKSSQYFVWVSRYTQKINVFKKENSKYKLVRVCECSTGCYMNYTGTIKGTKTMKSHRAKRKKSSYYYQYLSYFYLTNAVHGACYKYSGILKKSPSDRTSTLGCVRTWPTDAKFIYNCGKARVHIYY